MCETCGEGFTLLEGACLPCDDPNCSTCDAAGPATCDICNDPKSEYGADKATGKCVKVGAGGKVVLLGCGGCMGGVEVAC